MGDLVNHTPADKTETQSKHNRPVPRLVNIKRGNGQRGCGPNNHSAKYNDSKSPKHAREYMPYAGGM